MNKIIDDITNFIFISDEPRAADLILLPGGSYPEVPELGAKLYCGRFAPLIIASGGVSVKTGKFNGVKSKRDIYGKDYQTECEFYSDVLQINGVPESAIIREDKSGYTQENFLFSRKVADELGLMPRRVIVACKAFHARRCLMFAQFAFSGAEILIVPADVDGITRDNWHSTEKGVEQILGELARCGNQFVDEFKGRI